MRRKMYTSAAQPLATEIVNLLSTAGITDKVFGSLHDRFDTVINCSAEIGSKDFKIKALAPGRADSEIFGRGMEKKYGSAPGMPRILALAQEFCDELPRAYKLKKIYDKLRSSLGTPRIYRHGNEDSRKVSPRQQHRTPERHRRTTQTHYFRCRDAIYLRATRHEARNTTHRRVSGTHQEFSGTTSSPS